jgi:hypothetical protein
MADLENKIEVDPLEVCGPLAERFVKGVCENVESFDDVYGTEVEPVATEAYDGFIPFTDGGFDGVAYGLLSYAHGSGSAPAPIQAIIDSSLRDAESEFEREHGVTVESLYLQRQEMWEQWEAQKTLPGLDRPSYPPEPELLETWYEFQDSWLSEGGTYFYKVRVLFYRPDNYRNNSGDYEVRMFAYLNTDLDYGRDSIPWLRCYGKNPDQTTGDWERTMTAAEFIALGETGIDSLIEEATVHLRDL